MKIKGNTFLIISFTFLFVVYYILNIIFPTDFIDETNNANRIYPQIALGLLFAYMVLICLFYLKTILKNHLLYAYILFLLLGLVYVFYPLRIIENFAFFSRSYIALISLLTFYVFLNLDNHLTKRCIYCIYLSQIIYSFCVLVQDKILFNANLSNFELFNSNSGFMLATCIPMSLLLPQKRLRVYVYFLLVAACLYSGQRSAAVIAVLSIPFSIRYVRKYVKKFDIVLLVLIGVICTPVVVSSVFNLIERTVYDIDRDNLGSGRSIFWRMTLEGYLDGSLAELLFGKGTNTVPDLLIQKYGMAIGAHNGWLDILYSLGIFGLILYIATIINFLKIEIRCRQKLYQYRNIGLIMFIIFVVKASTSHGYFDVSMIPFSMAIAIMISQLNITKKKRLFAITPKVSSAEENNGE